MSARRAVVALAFSPTLAQAHLVETGLGPVYDGITHFAVTPEDLLPVLAIAVFAGLGGTAHARRVAFTLPVAWFAGGLAGTLMRMPVAESLAWLPLLAMGGLVAATPRLSTRATTAMAVLLGLALGYGNGVAMAQAGAGMRGIAGITADVFVVATLASALAVVWQAGWMRIAWRIAGSWIAAGGLLLLGWTLRS